MEVEIGTDRLVFVAHADRIVTGLKTGIGVVVEINGCSVVEVVELVVVVDVEVVEELEIDKLMDGFNVVEGKTGETFLVVNAFVVGTRVVMAGALVVVLGVRVVEGRDVAGATYGIVATGE